MSYAGESYEALLSHLSKKKHVVWDWNGTLLNDVDHAVRTMNTLLEGHGLAPISKSHYREIFDFPVRKYYDRLGFDYSVESFERLCHRFVDQFMAEMHILPFMGNMESVLRELARSKVKQSILSATDQLNLEKMVGHFGVRIVCTRLWH